MIDNLKLYSLDKDGIPREVKIVRDQPIFAVDHNSLPKLSADLDYTFKVEANPGFWKEFKEMMDEHDRKMMENYDRYAKALECCLGPHGACVKCPLMPGSQGTSCREDLLRNMLSVLRNHQELHRQFMSMRKAAKNGEND